MKRRLIIVLSVVIGAAVLATGGTWAYINVLRDDAPDRLTLEDAPGSPAASRPGGSVDGTWAATTGSAAGYRVEEILFGQRAEAAGRTNKVTGEFLIAGTSVTEGGFTVDMASIKSDQSQRDSQFRGRIMDTTQFPTSTFELTKPVELGSIPDDGTKVTARATGNMTLRGTKRLVAIDLNAERVGDTIRVAGTLPIVFAEWNIPNPSGGPAQTEDQGVLEFLLVFGRAG